MTGNRFEIPDIRVLDAKSKHLIEILIKMHTSSKWGETLMSGYENDDIAYAVKRCSE